MAPKTKAPREKKKNIQVAATKVVEKNKTCHQLLNLALSTPGHSLAPGSHKKKQVSRSVKDGLHFPVGRIGRYLKEGRYSQHIGFGVPVYLAAILEYLTAEVLELVGQNRKDRKKVRIIPRHMMLGVMFNEELIKLLASGTITHGNMLPNIHESLLGDGTMEDAAKLPAEDVAKLPAEDVAKSPKKTTESP